MRVATAAVAFVLLRAGRGASAQARNLVSPQSTATVPLAPGTGSPGATLVPERRRRRPDAAGASRARRPGRTRGARRCRPLRPRRAGDRRRPDLARLCSQARCDRRVPSDQGRQSGGADIRAAAGQLCRPCELRPCQRGEGRAIARRDGARSLRHSRRRRPPGRSRRRCAHPHRADFVRHLIPAASSTPPSAGRSRRT